MPKMLVNGKKVVLTLKQYNAECVTLLITDENGATYYGLAFYTTGRIANVGCLDPSYIPFEIERGYLKITKNE